MLLAVELLLYQHVEQGGVRDISVTDIQEVTGMWSRRGAAVEALASLADDGIIIAGPVGPHGRRCQLAPAVSVGGPEKPEQQVVRKNRNTQASYLVRKNRNSGVPEKPEPPCIRTFEERDGEELSQQARTAVTVIEDSHVTVTDDEQTTASSTPPVSVAPIAQTVERDDDDGETTERQQSPDSQSVVTPRDDVRPTFAGKPGVPIPADDQREKSASDLMRELRREVFTKRASTVAPVPVTERVVHQPLGIGARVDSYQGEGTVQGFRADRRIDVLMDRTGVVKDWLPALLTLIPAAASA